MKKVTMELTNEDVRNMEKIQQRVRARSKVAVVSTALTVASSLIKTMSRGGTVIVCDTSGNTKEMFIPGVNG